MVSSWVEDRRRGRSKLMSNELRAGVADMLLGFGQLDDNQKAQEKQARDLEDRQRDQERTRLADERAVATHQDNLATNLLRRKTNEAAEARAVEQEKEEREWRLLRKKGEESKQQGVLIEKKRADAVKEARAGMQRGLSRAELEGLAKAAGVSPEALLLEADNAQTADNATAAEGVLKKRKTESEIAENEAQAKKALTPKAGPSPQALERQKKKDELLDLQIEAARGKGTPDSAPLRKEFNALPAVKQYNDVKVSYDKMQSAAKAPSAAGDIALIFTYMKMLDPTSTVREGEFATAQNATGVPDQVLNQYNKVMSGERLNDQQRNDFLSQGRNHLAAHKTAYDAEAARYGGLASEQKVSPASVTGEASADEMKEFEQMTTAELRALVGGP